MPLCNEQTSSSVNSFIVLRCYRRGWYSAQDLYSGGTGFESPPGHGQSCLLQSVIMPWLGHDRFLRNPFQFIIHQSSSQSMLYRWRVTCLYRQHLVQLSWHNIVKPRYGVTVCWQRFVAVYRHNGKPKLRVIGNFYSQTFMTASWEWHCIKIWLYTSSDSLKCSNFLPSTLTHWVFPERSVKRWQTGIRWHSIRPCSC